MARLNATEATTPATFTIAYSDLARLVGIVAPSASLGPIFNCVHFCAHDGKIELRATDRYCYAIARGEASAPDGLNFALPLKSIKHLLSTFKPGRRADFALAFTVSPDAVTVTTAQPAIDQPDVTANYAVESGAYPKPRITITPSDQPAALNPYYLRRIPAIARNEPVMFLAGEPGKACGFYGPGWVVYIMAMRAVEHSADWCAAFDAPAPKLAAIETEATA